MHASVRTAFPAFSRRFEGRVLHMYLDVKGLVTTGVGNLIDPVSEALRLPWRHQATGERASLEEVAQAWARLKARQELAQRRAEYALPITGLVLEEADVDALVEERLLANERYLIRTFVEFESYPADAQLGILSMAWAVGAGFTRKFPVFTQSALMKRWWECASGCKIREEGNPGIVPRNEANRLCFQNASAVVATDADRSILRWPGHFDPAAERADAVERIAGPQLAQVRTDPNDEFDPDGEVTTPDLPGNIR